MSLSIIPQPWTDEAHCRTVDPRAFYPPAGQIGHNMAEVAKAICADCPVQTACLTYALELGERFGIWGGLDAQERQSLRKASA